MGPLVRQGAGSAPRCSARDGDPRAITSYLRLDHVGGRRPSDGDTWQERRLPSWRRHGDGRRDGWWPCSSEEAEFNVCCEHNRRRAPLNVLHKNCELGSKPPASKIVGRKLCPTLKTSPHHFTKHLRAYSGVLGRVDHTREPLLHSSPFLHHGHLRKAHQDKNQEVDSVSRPSAQTISPSPLLSQLTSPQRRRPGQGRPPVPPTPADLQGDQGSRGPARAGPPLLHRVRQVVRDGLEPGRSREWQAPQEEVGLSLSCSRFLFLTRLGVG